LPDSVERTDLPERLLLYLVADPDHVRGNLLTMLREAIAGGVTAVQLRAKCRTDRETLETAKRIREIAADVLFLVNDRLDIALASDADGVHLGVDDLPVTEARKLASDGFVIGYSPDSDQATRAAKGDGASYLGVGPVFSTSTKTDAGEAIGLKTIERRARLAGIPVIGIGGLDESNARSVVGRGAAGVAVISAIALAADPRRAAAQLRQALER
jgi:thiamine-phosphate pyrophosphorylase